MSLPLLLSAKCVSVTGGQDRRMFPCLSCFPSFCSPLFKPLRGKPHSPSLNSTLSTPVDRQSTGKYPRGATFFLLLFFLNLFFLPAYKHRDTELQQSGRAGSRDVLHAEYGECQFVFPNLAVICFHCCACRAAAGNCVSAWCVVVNDDPINQSINKNLRRERTALDKLACAD